MKATLLTDRLIQDLDMAIKAATIIPVPENVAKKVSDFALKGEIPKFYVEEFTASTSLYVSMPASIKRLARHLNIGDVIIDEKGTKSLWNFFEEMKSKQKHVEEKIRNIVETKSLVFTDGQKVTPIFDLLIGELDEFNREARVVKACVDKIVG